MRPQTQRTASLRTGAVALLFVASACAENAPLGTTPLELAPAPRQEMACVADVRAGKVECSGPAPLATGGALGDVQVVGGQGINVKLQSSNVSYDSDSEVFAFDVTVQNLLPEALGTTDGVTPHANGVRVFFDQDPATSGGTGTVSVANEDGSTGFKGSEPKAYFQWDGVLATDQVSAKQTFELSVPRGVQTFTFGLYVAAEAQPLVVINEILANPTDAGVYADSTGEYVELYNRGRLPANLRGYTVHDNGTVTEPINADVVVPAGGYALLVRSGNKDKNGGLNADWAWAARIGTSNTNLSLSNSGADRWVIRAPTGVIVDSVSYTSSSVAAKNGVARELKDPTLDNTNVDGANWQDATATFTGVTKGTPRAPNTGATTGGGTTTPPGPATSVTVSPGTATMAPGETRQFSATARDANGQVTQTTFTYSSTNTGVATVNASGLVTAVANGSTSIVALSANGVSNQAAVTVATSSTSASYRNHLEFGVPTDSDQSNDIRLDKREFSLSYSAARGGPNWVAWDLNATHFGPADRCDCFAPDQTLPAGVYRVVTGDYTGSGYSRGHMVMSSQRTATSADNTSTFLMTNMLPQYQDLNGGPWLRFEEYISGLARTGGKEVYNIAGGVWGASPATLSNAGKVQIPSHTWKVIVIMPAGRGLADITSASDFQVIAVNMPNALGIASNGWEMYRTSVDAVEAATGYDLLSALPDAIEAAVEAGS